MPVDLGFLICNERKPGQMISQSSCEQVLNPYREHLENQGDVGSCEGAQREKEAPRIKLLIESFHFLPGTDLSPPRITTKCSLGS